MGIRVLLWRFGERGERQNDQNSMNERVGDLEIRVFLWGFGERGRAMEIGYGEASFVQCFRGRAMEITML